MGLPTCGECGSRLSWWSIYKDITFGNEKKHPYVDCRNCCTKNRKRTAPYMTFNLLLIIILAAFGMFVSLEFIPAVIITIGLTLFISVIFTFFIGYDPVYLPGEPKEFN